MTENLAACVADLLVAEGSPRAREFANALERGEIDRSSPAGVIQARLGISQARMRPYRDVLSVDATTSELALGLRIAAETASRVVESQPQIQVAWTYPGKARPGLRTTGGVAREIVQRSSNSLLIVGYSVTVDPTLTGLAAQTIDAIARAAERGVAITAVLHRDVNPDALLQAWRGGVRRPSLFKWVQDDAKASVHAKVLIADRFDALVTSANLTYHGFQGNLEMGLRVKGPPAAEIYDRINELIASGEFVPWAT